MVVMAEGGAESDPGVCGAAAMPDTRQDSARWHGALGGDGDLCFMEVAEEREATPGQPQDSEDPQKLVRWVSTLAPELQADLLLLCDLEGEAPPSGKHAPDELAPGSCLPFRLNTYCTRSDICYWPMLAPAVHTRSW